MRRRDPGREDGHEEQEEHDEQSDHPQLLPPEPVGRQLQIGAILPTIPGCALIQQYRLLDIARQLDGIHHPVRPPISRTRGSSTV